MSNQHTHGGHGGHNHGEENLNDRQLIFAVAINVLLTLAQVVGGIVSGSLSLPTPFTTSVTPPRSASRGSPVGSAGVPPTDG